MIVLNVRKSLKFREGKPQHVYMFYEICSYLSSNEVFCLLAVICKDWNNEITSPRFLEY